MQRGGNYMSLLQVTYFSEALARTTTFYMYLPNDVPEGTRKGNIHYERPTKTLYLLHGYSGTASDWVTGSSAQELAIQYNLAIVMPSGENSFYLNGKGTGRAFETFVGEELISYVTRTFGLSDKKEDNFIGGLSMGGFGAIHTGLKYPENYGKMFGLSSAFIINSIKDMKPGTKDGLADYDYYVQTFGPLEELEESENNPEYVVKRRIENGEEIQPIFMACGTWDFLLKENRNFYNFLKDCGVQVTYQEAPGVHNWKFWDKHLEPAIQWLLGQEL